jgi:hypothetical protein
VVVAAVVEALLQMEQVLQAVQAAALGQLWVAVRELLGKVLLAEHLLAVNQAQVVVVQAQWEVQTQALMVAQAVRVWHLPFLG